MSESDGDPDWACLPHDPAAFFGLEHGFDLKELKRQYSRLIKRFKPEKAPAEFQRIRAAYETLESQFQRGVSFDGQTFRLEVVSDNQRSSETIRPFSPNENVNPGSDYEVEFQEQSVQRARREPRRLRDRVLQASPDDLLLELESQRVRTQDEELVLTFLRDARNLQRPTAFLDDLLSRFNSFGDEESYELLREYLQGSEAADHCDAFLIRIFERLESDETYVVSEPLWECLIKRGRFTTFLEVWQACLKLVRDQQQLTHLFFRIRMLRRLMFFAPIEWISQELAQLTQGDAIRADWPDAEILQLEPLADYVRVRAEFLNSNALRAEFDQLVQAYCHDSPDLDQRFLAFQTLVAIDLALADKAFGGSVATLQHVWTISQTIGETVAARHDRRQHLEETISDAQLRPAFRRLQRSSRVLTNAPWHWPRWYWITVLTFYLMLPAGFYFCSQWFQSTTVQEAKNRALVCFLTVMIVHVVIEFVDLTDDGWSTWPCYSRGMRRKLISIFQWHRISLPHLCARLRSLSLESTHSQKILTKIENDYALRFYANAILFVGAFNES